MNKLLLTFNFLLFFYSPFSQTRRIEAAKTGNSIKIDGDINDAAWKEILPVTGFVTSTPVYGNKPQQTTFVKITYDNSAVYILAYMHTDQSNVRKQLTARDNTDLQDADVFSVGFDTYNDKQNGFLFQVTAAGVQGDARLSASIDKTWDAVWESKVSIKKDGWVAEIKIPFSAIRFSKSSIQTWGIQFTTFSRKTNETSTWSPDDPAVNGIINKWGEWRGLQNITPPLRLSFLPYLSGGVKISPAGNKQNNRIFKERWHGCKIWNQ